MNKLLDYHLLDSTVPVKNIITGDKVEEDSSCGIFHVQDAEYLDFEILNGYLGSMIRTSQLSFRKRMLSWRQL